MSQSPLIHPAYVIHPCECKSSWLWVAWSYKFIVLKRTRKMSHGSFKTSKLIWFISCIRKTPLFMCPSTEVRFADTNRIQIKTMFLLAIIFFKCSSSRSTPFLTTGGLKVSVALTRILRTLKRSPSHQKGIFKVYAV